MDPVIMQQSTHLPVEFTPVVVVMAEPVTVQQSTHLPAESQSTPVVMAMAEPVTLQQSTHLPAECTPVVVAVSLGIFLASYDHIFHADHAVAHHYSIGGFAGQ